MNAKRQQVSPSPAPFPAGRLASLGGKYVGHLGGPPLHSGSMAALLKNPLGSLACKANEARFMQKERKRNEKKDKVKNKKGNVKKAGK